MSNRSTFFFYLFFFQFKLLIFRVVRGPFIEDFYQCHTQGFYTAVWQEQLYTTFSLVFMFIIPLFVIIITYLSTFRTISGECERIIIKDTLNPILT